MLSRRAFLAGASLAGLSACAGEPVWAPEDQVRAKVYRGTGPKSLTLYTMIDVRDGSGAHSSVLVDASQRVMFDPAGTFGHPTIPERNDVLFGMSPRVEQYYVSYHARVTFYVVGQTVFVSPEVAERALQMFMANGPVAKANCTRVTSSILRQLPGFESLPQTWFPVVLMDAFQQLPGVVRTEHRESDADDKTLAARQVDMQIRAGQSQ